MTMNQILQPDDIYLDVPLERKKDIFQFLAERVGEKTAADVPDCRSALTAREKLGSTAVGSGIAIPHAQLQGLEHTQALFIRLASPVAFGAPDEEPVDIILMLLTPLGATGEHLETLSRLAKLLRSSVTMQQLRDAQSPEEILQVFQR